MDKVYISIFGSEIWEKIPGKTESFTFPKQLENNGHHPTVPVGSTKLSQMLSAL